MARSRNIKPGFFKNDVLAEIDPLGRILFAGLWTLADFKGELEWRHKKIKAELLPYDDCDVIKLAINLDKSGFIRFYSDGEKIFLKVVAFEEHQNPHKNEREKGSKIPCYSETMRQAVDLTSITIKRDKSGLNQECSASDRADSLNLIPDSLNLIPDSCSLIPDSKALDKSNLSSEPDVKVKNKYSDDVKEIFNYWVFRMEKSDQAKLTDKRKNKIIARLKEDYSVEFIKSAVDGCAKSPHHMGANDSGTVYDDLELICRDGTKLENFASNIAKVVPMRRGQGETVEQTLDRSQESVQRVLASGLLDDIK